MKNYYDIEIIIDDEQKIRLTLDHTKAPITVENFIKLVNQKYFDGVVFHRIIKDFMIQTGGYYIEHNELKEKEEVESIFGEFKSNGFDNPIKHELGVISMARTNIKNSASSQFFICAGDCHWLDGEYAAFGKTMDEESNQVVLNIDSIPTCPLGPGFDDFPRYEIAIRTINILKEYD